jgi:16S rRNA processing protein RimM
MLLVGIIRRPHGVSGEVSVEVATDFPERFASGRSLLWRRADAEQSLTIASVRPHGKRLLMRFETVEGGDAARALAGGELWVPEAEAVPPPEDSYYVHELEGFRCEDPSGRFLGTAERLEQTRGAATLVLRTESGKPVAVPFVRPIVSSVDRAKRRVVLDPPEGLMEL